MDLYSVIIEGGGGLPIFMGGALNFDVVPKYPCRGRMLIKLMSSKKAWKRLLKSLHGEYCRYYRWLHFLQLQLMSGQDLT